MARRLLEVAEEQEFRWAGSWLSLVRQKRTIKVETAEFVGLTAAGAASQSATGGWDIVSRRRTGERFWTVTEQKTTEGAWENV